MKVHSPQSTVHRSNRIRFIFFVLAVFLWTMDYRLSTVFGCPMCKEAIAGQDPASLHLTQGYACSIALLMGAPYLLFAGMAFWVARSTRRTKKITQSQS